MTISPEFDSVLALDGLAKAILNEGDYLEWKMSMMAYSLEQTVLRIKIAKHCQQGERVLVGRENVLGYRPAPTTPAPKAIIIHNDGSVTKQFV